MGLFSKKTDQKLAYCVTAASGMGMNTGLVFVMEMAKKMSACLEDYAKKDPEASKKLHGLIEHRFERDCGAQRRGHSAD